MADGVERKECATVAPTPNAEIAGHTNIRSISTEKMKDFLVSDAFLYRDFGELNVLIFLFLLAYI
jgi:hypothetical protein